MGRDTRTDLYKDRRHYVWNNDHDTATLRNDHGRFVDDYSWGRDRDQRAATATAGVTTCAVDSPLVVGR